MPPKVTLVRPWMESFVAVVRWLTLNKFVVVAARLRVLLTARVPMDAPKESVLPPWRVTAPLMVP